MDNLLYREIECRNWNWEELERVNLDGEIFSAPLRKDIIARVIRWQMAKARSGNHSTKTLSMVSGTTKKPWAQKETGKARQGSLRAPHFRGGAVVFGPHPRSYEHKLNKKIRNIGLKSSLTYKLNEGSVFVMNNLDFNFDKTAKMNSWLLNRGFKSVLFVFGYDFSMKNAKCIRNIPYCDIISVNGLNVLDIVKHKNIIFDKTSIKLIEERLKTKQNRGKYA